MRLYIARAVVAVGAAAGLMLSPKLWQTDRSYPTIPVYDALPDVSAAAGVAVYSILLALLALVALLPRRWPVLAFVGLAFLWCLWDQMRWQPWFYQYLAFLTAIGLARRDDALNTCRLVLAATYFWSGLQKVNVSFVTDLYPWLIQPVQRLLPDAVAAWLGEQGYVVAAGECALGIALMVPQLRAVAVPLVVVMHAGLLFCLGPMGHDWNSIVWPWNVTLPVLIVVLFARTRDVPARRILWGSWVGRVVLLLFGVMPALCFIGWWDAYLSASLYSGNTPYAEITLDETAGAAMPTDVRERFVSWNGYVDLQGWAIDELNVPGYPSRRVFRGLARRLGGPDHVRLVTHDRPDWRTGERETIEEDLSP